MKTLVIDTNIIISALLKEGAIRKILLDHKFNFIFPDYGLKEIYFYKDYIIKKSKIKEVEFDRLMLRIFKYIRLVPWQIIKKFKKLANEVIGKIDKKDAVFVATALAFKCPIWSNDEYFKLQKTIRIYSTKELIGFILSK